MKEEFNKNDIKNTQELESIMKDFSKLESDIPIGAKERTQNELEKAIDFYKKSKLVFNNLSKEARLDLLRRSALEFKKEFSDEHEDILNEFINNGKLASLGIPHNDYAAYTINVEEDTIYCSVSSLDLKNHWSLSAFIKMYVFYSNIMKELFKIAPPEFVKRLEFLQKMNEDLQCYNIKDLLTNPIDGSIEKEDSMDTVKILTNYYKDIMNSQVYSDEEKKEAIIKLKNKLKALSEISGLGEIKSMEKLDEFIRERFDENYVPEENLNISDILDEDVIKEIKDIKSKINDFSYKESKDGEETSNINENDKSEETLLEEVRDFIKSTLNSSEVNDSLENTIETESYEDFVEKCKKFNKEFGEEEFDYSQITPSMGSIKMQKIMNKVLIDSIEENNDRLSAILTNDIIYQEDEIDVDYLKSIYSQYGAEAVQEEISRLPKEKQISIISELTKALNLQADIE